MKKAGLTVWILLLLGWAMPATAAPVTNWVETDRVQFSGTDGFFRSQGVASDDKTLFFSWNLGLSRTEIDDTSKVIADNTTNAIPEDLIATNHNHIGDIDVADGIIYAPIEDGPQYLAPWIVLYDAKTLQPTGQRYLLAADILRDGVPWIAVDKPNGLAYTMEWGDTGKLFVYRLDDFQLVKTVELSRPVPRIQGAKMFRGELYGSVDNKGVQSFVAINPESGLVTDLFDRNLGEDYESEGIAFVRRPTGTMMVSTGIRKGAQGYTEMRVYRIGGDTSAPILRKLAFKPAKIRKGKKPTLTFNSSESASARLRWQKCVGPRRRPCAKKRTVSSSQLSLKAGANRISLPKRGVGRWVLSLTPTDAADIVGPTRQASLTVLKPRR